MIGNFAKYAILAAAALFPTALAASSGPIALSLQFTPPKDAAWPTGSRTLPGDPAAPQCTVAIASVEDKRTDPDSMGALYRPMSAGTDVPAWIKAGVEALGRDPRLKFADANAAVTLNVELLKAYVMNVTSETRTVNMVLRVRYGDDPQDAHVYRGATDNITWIDEGSETESSFNDAFAQLLVGVDRDIAARCTAGHP